MSQAIDLMGQYRDPGVHLLINSDYLNDRETLGIIASDIMSHFIRWSGALAREPRRP